MSLRVEDKADAEMMSWAFGRDWDKIPKPLWYNRWHILHPGLYKIPRKEKISVSLDKIRRIYMERAEK